MFSRLNSQLFIIVCHSNGVVRFAPLYIYSFPFLQPHFLAEAEKVNIGNDSLAKFDTIADRLRYYRHRKGLLQREVADCVGIERTTYSAYEEEKRDYYPIDILERIAELYGVKPTDVIDDYNLFLLNGQASQVKALRKKTKLTQADFANHVGVTKQQIKGWEQGRARMTKKFWQKVFERLSI